MTILQFVSDALLEFFLCISHPFLGILNRILNDKNKKSDNGRVVVIVESWLNTNYLHTFLVHFLRRKGYIVYMKNFPLQKGGFEDKADELNEFILQNNLTNFSLIGISGGAITSLCYLEKYDKWQGINKFIAIGAPFKGTPLIYPLVFLKSARQLLPNSVFLKDLKIRYPKKIVSVYAFFDEMVPRKSSIIQDAKNIEIPVVGHNNLHMLSGDMYEEVSSELS
jgi:hypothetical protein